MELLPWHLILVLGIIYGLSINPKSLSCSSIPRRVRYVTPQNVVSIGYRRTIDLARHTLSQQELSEWQDTFDDHLALEIVDRDMNQKLQKLQDQTNRILEQTKAEVTKEAEYQRKIKVLDRVVRHYNLLVRAIHEKSVKFWRQIDPEVGFEDDSEDNSRRRRSAERVMENSPVQRIYYNLEILMEDVGRWKKWIEKASHKWNNEQRNAYSAAVHLMMSSLYQYRRITYQIMFDKNLLSVLALELPMPRNDFLFNNKKIISFTKVGSKLLVKIQDKERHSGPHEFRVGGFVSVEGNLSIGMISNFTKELSMSHEQEEAVLRFVNINIDKSAFHWTPWSLWSTCSVTCGMNGFKTRQRVCLVVNIHPMNCSGGDTERISCSATQVCQTHSDIICWVEGMGFLKENFDCECSFLPNLCLNNGICVRKVVINSSLSALPHYVLGCQCPLGFSGQVCEYAWFTPSNFFLFGCFVLILLVANILLCYMFFRWCSKSKSSNLKGTSSETLRLLQSGNAGDFDEDLALAEPRQYSRNSVHSSRGSEHTHPHKIEQYPNDLLFNQTRKESKNSNTNTGTSAVEKLNLNQKSDKSDAVTEINQNLVSPIPDISQKSENSSQVVSSICTDEFTNDLPNKVQNVQLPREISSAENNEIDTSVRNSCSKRNKSIHPLLSATKICHKDMSEILSACESQVEHKEQMHPGHSREFLRINERRENGLCRESRFRRHSEMKFYRTNKPNFSKFSEKISRCTRKTHDPRGKSRTVASEEKQNIVCPYCDRRKFHNDRSDCFLNNKKRTTIDSWVNMASTSMHGSKPNKSLATNNDSFCQHSSGRDLLKRLVFVKNLPEAGKVIKKRKCRTSTNVACKRLSNAYLPARCVKESRGRFKSLGTINHISELSPKTEERLIFG